MNDSTVCSTPRVDLAWPAEGVSRVPYRVYTDEELYRAEQERIFRGDVWQFLGFEVEVPNVGDFKTTWVGDTPVVMTRSGENRFSAFVNRCAHRGATLCFEPCGHRERFTCVYHNWTYDLDGELKSVAFHKGVRGVGGLPEDFKLADHNLKPMRVETICGLVFGTFSPRVAQLEDYLGERTVQHLRRVFSRPIKVIGAYSQYLHNNWKLYIENVKDSYHAGILHLFLATFQLNRLSMQGGLYVDEENGHHLSFSKRLTDQAKGTEYEAGGLRAQNDGFRLNDPRLLDNWIEFEDGITNAIQSIFPNLVVQQIQNSLAVRLLVPRGVNECELYWTLFGYVDDTPEQEQTRIRLSNLVGPAGLVSMEDGIVGNFVQRAIGERPADSAVVEMGGRTVESQQSRVSEAAVRGFWQCYRKHLGI